MLAHQSILEAFVLALKATPGLDGRVYSERSADLGVGAVPAILIEDDGTESTELGPFCREQMVLSVVIKVEDKAPRAACYALLELAHPLLVGQLRRDDGQVQSIRRLSHAFDRSPAAVSVGELTVRYLVTFECDTETLN